MGSLAGYGPLRPTAREFVAAPQPPRVVLAVGTCGLYTGPWGVRVEDTVVIGADGPTILTDFRRELRP